MTDSDDVTTVTTSTTSSAEAAPARAPRRASGLRLVLGIVLTLALVASACVFVWLLAQRRGEAGSEQLEREEAMAQARQFMLRLNTYGPELLEGEQMPAYREQVSEVITSKFDADFEATGLPLAEQTVAQASIARTCQVFATGVSVIDEDSATALVAGAFVNSFPETPGATERIDADPAPFRVEVKLVKTGGTWLVDDFDPVTGTDQDEQPAPGTPSEVPDIVPDETADPTIEPSTGATP